MAAFINAAIRYHGRHKTNVLTISPLRPHLPYSFPVHRTKQAHIRCDGRAAPRMGSSNTTQKAQQDVFTKVWEFVTLLYPLWTVMAAGIALARPRLFGGLRNAVLMRRMLSVLMLSTGLTLTGKELLEASRRPWPLFFSFLCCYAVMPGLAFLLMKLFRLDGVYGAGLLLLGFVSGGQASNLCTLIAGGDVALSVAMTTLTSVASVIAIPSLSAWLLGQAIEVDPMAVGRSTLELVALPLLFGAGMNTLFPGRIRRIKGALPVVGILTVLVLIIGPVAETSGMFFGAARRLVAPVVLLHVLGGLIGFVIPLLFGCERRTAVTTGFEAGFKSPVLSFVLARQHFGDGVGMASIVSIVVLAPLAALFAVIIRLLEQGERKVGSGGIGDGVRMDNKRYKFKVAGHDGKTYVVGYEQLGAVLARAKKRGGVRAVERVTEE